MKVAHYPQNYPVCLCVLSGYNWRFASPTSLAKTHRNRSRPDSDCAGAHLARARARAGCGGRHCRAAHDSRIPQADRVLRRKADGLADTSVRRIVLRVAGDQRWWRGPTSGDGEIFGHAGILSRPGAIYFPHARHAERRPEQRDIRQPRLRCSPSPTSRCPWRCWCSFGSKRLARFICCICCWWFGRETSSPTSWARRLAGI